MTRRAPRPFVFINVAMTADGKIAPVTRHFKPFGGPQDQKQMLELRATADAVMAGARTVDLARVKLGPGPERYRNLRLQNGRAEFNLRVVVSGRGTVNPEAEVFQHRFSPLIILTTAKAVASRLARLRAVADEVKICGLKEVDFNEALPWLRQKWKVRRLLCEGGGEVNAALFQNNLVDEIHLTLCPLLLGGRTAPTLCDGDGVNQLADASRFRLASLKRAGDAVFLIYRRRN